jgi:hypothetical protein
MLKNYASLALIEKDSNMTPPLHFSKERTTDHAPMLFFHFHFAESIYFRLSIGVLYIPILIYFLRLA